MSWFRTRSKLGSYIALFALAFQLVVSFGHVHLYGAGRHSSTTIETADSAPSSPANHEGPDHADPYCAICALIHLAGAIVPAELPSIPLPVVFGPWRPDVAEKYGWTAPPPAFFPARAPPIA